MTSDLYDLVTLADQFCDLLDESELVKGADQMRAAGFPESEIRSMEIMITISDDPKRAEAAIGEYYAERQRQAALEQWIEELPAACPTVEVENLSRQTGLPTEVVDQRLGEIEKHLDAMANNPFSRRF